jgi:hypothetical protein
MVTKVVTTHLPHELAEKLDEIANRLERSRGWIVSADSWNIQSQCGTDRSASS